MTRRVGDGVNPGPPALVITGASNGIGHATGKLAVAQGWRVFGSVRKAVDADDLNGEFGPSFTPLLFDVRDLRCAPAQHALWSRRFRVLLQSARRISSSSQALGLKPDPERALKGISV
jgi:NADP-dependent 3-hydroxy acid dehydrogenase YdfG